MNLLLRFDFLNLRKFKGSLLKLSLVLFKNIMAIFLIIFDFLTFFNIIHPGRFFSFSFFDLAFLWLLLAAS
jgi:hypothetical protein